MRRTHSLRVKMCVPDDVRATYVLQLYHACGETASDSPQQTTEYCNRDHTERRGHARRSSEPGQLRNSCCAFRARTKP